MTVLAPTRAAVPDRRAGPPGSVQRPDPPAWSWASEAALAAVTVAAVYGLGRLFSGTGFFAPLVVVALAGHALAWGSRRLALGPATAAALSGIGLVLTVAWVVEPQTLTYGLPLGPTWDAVRNDLAVAWERFGMVRAPVEATRGFVLAAAVAVWLAAFLADSFAFRFRARFEALLPSFVVFVFGAVLGADRHRVAVTGVYLGAVLVFVVLSGLQTSRMSWLAGRSADGETALVRNGLLGALAALVAAVTLGPHLPGAASDALVSWREGRNRGSSSRVTVSPLVDIRSRLINQAGVEVFTVRSDLPGYWRLTSLDRFDGTIWSSLASYREVRNRLPAGGSGAAAATTEMINQQFEITGLDTIWLPAAYRPDRLDIAPTVPAADGSGEPDDGVRYDPESSSLLTDATTPQGLRYDVVSARPTASVDELNLARGEVPPEVKETYLGLPPEFPLRVRELARTVTAGATGPYTTARALQDWFRESFTYDLNATPPGHDQSAIERFLFETKRGYCEQFAGSYAAMARSLGLPARVAVGFTPGQPGPDGAFRVTDAEAHAWPEVYLAGFGWMAFEPTPSRGAPGAESYTGVSPSGAAESRETTVTLPSAAPPPEATTTVPGPDDEQAPTLESTEPAGGGGLGAGTVLALLALAAVAYAAAVPGVHRLARTRRRAGAVTPEDRVLLAWREVQEELALAGVRRRSSETDAEYARRAGGGGDSSRPAGASVQDLEQLAADSSVAAFAPAGPPDAVAVRAEEASAAIRTRVRAQARPWQKARASLDPRPVLEMLRDLRRRNRA